MGPNFPPLIKINESISGITDGDRYKSWLEINLNRKSNSSIEVQGRIYYFYFQGIRKPGHRLGKQRGEKILLCASCGSQRGDRVSSPGLGKVPTRWYSLWSRPLPVGLSRPCSLLKLPPYLTTDGYKLRWFTTEQ